MATVAPPRRSLDLESSRSPSVATQNPPTQRTFRRMFQDTLRATGLSRQRDRDIPVSERPPIPPQSTSNDKDKEKNKSKDDTRRHMKITFARKPKLSISHKSDKDDAQQEERPFMGSLRHASMSSPVLPLFNNPFTVPDNSPASGSRTPAIAIPVRPRVDTRRSSTSRDKDKEFTTPLQISRPRPLAASPSAAANAARSVSPSSQRNKSPPPRMSRFPSTSTSNLPSTSQQRAISPTFHSRNTSTTSLNTSSPYRETIRTASSLLIKHLSRPPPPLRPHEWQDVELRLRALSRLERIWGKSGGGSSATAVGSGSAFGGGEERERRLFCEAVRDGYVLCALLNKFRPGTIARPDPKEDGFTKTSNVTKFLAGALNYGVANADLFRRDDLLEASGESLERVAKTIIALVKLSEPLPPSSTGSRGPYMSIRDATMSSPNLLDSRSLSPTSRSPYQRKRYSPPSGLHSVPGSKPGTPSDATTTKQGRSTSMSHPNGGSITEGLRATSPAPPPRSPLRPQLSARASIGSSITDTTTIFSSSDARTSTRFGTVRTVATEATSILPSDTASISGQRQDLKAALSESPAEQPSSYQTQFTEIPTTSRRRSYDREAAAARLTMAVSQSPTMDLGSPTRLWRERRSSDLPPPDLSNVEEVDEYGTRRGRPPQEVAVSLNSTSTPPVSPRRVSFDRPRPSFERRRDSPLGQAEVDLSSSPPTAKAGLPLRRPMHGHRHSVDTVTQTPMLLPIPRHSSLSRERDLQPSPSSSRESSTPSPPIGASRVSLVPRKSTSRPSPRASYVPKLNGTDDARVSSSYRHRAESDQIETTSTAPVAPRVPFPRSTSGDSAILGSPEPSRLAPLPSSTDSRSRNETDSIDGANRDSRDTYRRSAHPGLLRGRYNSELDTTGTRARKPRPNSLDDGGGRPGRSRFESMMNLGTGADALSRESSLSVNAIRQPLIVREEGKPPMHYQIGNGIGRGQFGAVYRALNLNTGQMVAVKRISLQGLSEDEISNLMREVDVLKRLSHPSIVKYEGMVRSTDTLSIVLEYVENGSLGQTIKAFGKLNERLVATYITKILEGLHYLHAQHVVHCDLKAANILTTKNGNVKLSDFGVSLNLHAKALEEIRNDVAGTPNWMAPEVIQLKGPSPASDIWSLGCTAIELLTGHPPYHEIHNGMSVMFRIVEDDEPPIPPECSPLMEDFLKQCFMKDPQKRPNAETLFEHPWLKTAWGEHKELRPQDSIPFLRRVSVEVAKSESSRGLSVDTRGTPKSESSQDLSAIGAKSNVNGPLSPLSPLTPLSPDSAEGPVRQHSFIKTTFGRAVTCRVCHQSVKRSAVLCEECGLFAHARCAADAPASCDIRTQLLLYSQYSQANNSQELSTPTREHGTPPASAPIPIPSSPRRSRRDSDATFSSSPKFSERLLNWKRSHKSMELLSPPLRPAASPTSYHPPREETPTPTPTPLAPAFINTPSSPKRLEKMRKPSRLSFQSAANTDSMRSMVTAAETASSSTASYSSTPRSSVPPGAKPRPILTNPLPTNTPPATDENVPTQSRRDNTRMSAISTTASEFGEEKKKIKRNRRDSVSSKDSQCIIL